MNELFDASLPWWGWALMLTGLVGLVSVVGALFLPDWKQPDYTLGPTAAAGTEAFAVEAASALGMPLYRGGQATVLQNGDAFFPEMLEAIRGARDSVNFEVYIFEPDELGRRFMDAFIDRARAGVEVRLLVDWFGSWRLRKRHVEELTGAGVRVECFRPLTPRHLIRIYRRTHRRAIVIDGRIGFTGGAAVSQKWAGDVRTKHEWRDSMTRVTGPLVCGIQAAFVENWLYCTGEVLAGERFFPPTESQPGPVRGLRGQLAVGGAAARPAPVLDELRQRPPAALDQQLLLHSRSPPARRGDRAGAPGRRRADPGARQPHRRRAGAARRAGRTTRSCSAPACGSTNSSRP